MGSPARLRPGSSLSESEQTDLMLARQPVLETEAPTCSFERKLERMQALLEARGVLIAEDEIRSPRRRKTKG